MRRLTAPPVPFRPPHSRAPPNQTSPRVPDLTPLAALVPLALARLAPVPLAALVPLALAPLALVSLAALVPLALAPPALVPLALVPPVLALPALAPLRTVAVERIPSLISSYVWVSGCRNVLCSILVKVEERLYLSSNHIALASIESISV
jgi:hypothetical protein